MRPGKVFVQNCTCYTWYTWFRCKLPFFMILIFTATIRHFLSLVACKVTPCAVLLKFIQSVITARWSETFWNRTLKLYIPLSILSWPNIVLYNGGNLHTEIPYDPGSLHIYDPFVLKSLTSCSCGYISDTDHFMDAVHGLDISKKLCNTTNHHICKMDALNVNATNAVCSVLRCGNES